MVSQWRTWRTCHFSPDPGGSLIKMCLVKLVTSVTTILMMSRTSKASFNSAKNIAAIRDQIVKDMGMDHIPDVKHVSLFNSFGKLLFKKNRRN